MVATTSKQKADKENQYQIAQTYIHITEENCADSKKQLFRNHQIRKQKTDMGAEVEKNSKLRVQKTSQKPAGFPNL